jgi:glycosyltransferase involved in cell wall biosynthesis
MNKKIAIIDTLGAHGGSFHYYTFGQAMGLIKAGYSVNIYTNNETKDPQIKGLCFFSFYKNIFSSSLKIISGFRWLIGSIKSIFHARFSSISIFHIHVFYVNILILFNLLIIKFLFGKVVVTIHDVRSFGGDKESSVIHRIVYLLTDLLLTHNDFSKLELKKVYPFIKTPIHIVPHGNYLPFVNRKVGKNKSRNYLNIPLNKKVVLFFGMIKKVKGLEILLNSLRDVVTHNPDIILIIAGRVWKNDFSIYQEIIDREKLHDHCIIHNNFIAHKDIDYYYAASDLVVLPYKKIYQSGVMMMALSYEVAVLSSDLAPLKEIITDNKTGFLFESENSESLSQRLNYIFSEKNIIEKVRKEGFTHVKENFNWTYIGSLTAKAYEYL